MASLGGTVTVILHRGFAAAEGQVVPLIEYNTVANNFAAVSLDKTTWDNPNLCQTVEANRGVFAFELQFMDCKQIGTESSTGDELNNDMASAGSSSTVWIVVVVVVLVVLTAIAGIVIVWRRARNLKELRTMTDEHW